MVTCTIRLCLSAGLIFCACGAGGAIAEDAAVDTPAEAVELITDQKNKTVTIVIDGQPVAQIGKDGLHVLGNISYGGVIRDVGETSILMPDDVKQEGSGE